MVGFGWLGALSGVAGVKARAELNLENKDLAEDAYQAETKLESSVEGLKKDRNKLMSIIEEGKNRILELNEEIERLKGNQKVEKR
jgi:prefoldin subunit 5